MQKKLISLLIISGGLFILIGIWENVKMKTAQVKALEQAKNVLNTVNVTQTSTEDSALEKKKNDEKTNNDVTIQEPIADNPLIDATIGETIGILKIPKINATYPIIYGVGEDELDMGVGHYPGTAFPTQNDQIVLAGHRDTVFGELGKLKEGDLFIVELPYGSFDYIMEEAVIVDKDDRTIIVPTAPREVLTVITCYPFSYVGNAPERYIINAVPATVKK